jgi:hypothetical protein
MQNGNYNDKQRFISKRVVLILQASRKKCTECRMMKRKILRNGLDEYTSFLRLMCLTAVVVCTVNNHFNSVYRVKRVDIHTLSD